MLKQAVRLFMFSVVVAVLATAGCGGNQTEEAAREEVKEQEVLRQKQEIEDAAANIELRRSEKQ